MKRVLLFLTLVVLSTAHKCIHNQLMSGFSPKIGKEPLSASFRDADPAEWDKMRIVFEMEDSLAEKYKDGDDRA